MLYISGRLRMHACMQCIRAPPTLVCRPIIWQVQNGDHIRAYRSSKTPDRLCVVREPYGATILKLVLGHVR